MTMSIKFPTSVFVCACLTIAATAVSQDDRAESGSQTDSRNAQGLWDSHVAELLKQNCQKCHNEKKASGKLSLDSNESIFRGGKKGPAVVPGVPGKSLIYRLVQKEAKPHMPPGGKQLSDEQIAILKHWIERLDPKMAKATLNATSKKIANSKKTDRSNGKWLPPPGVHPTSVIDLLIESRWISDQAKIANPISDRRFARRLFLDLVGRIPSATEMDRFLANTQSGKRELLVDQLLSSHEHAAYFASLFDTLLMGRGDSRKYAQRNSSGWDNYLKMVFQQNRPWNDVVREMLLARPDDATNDGFTWFLYERNNKHQEIAEAIGPAVFGIRVECAQCHDHPLAGEIEQRHYWGLVAFFRRGKNVNTKNGPRIAESAVGGFEQFTDLSGQSHANQLVFFGKPVVKDTRPKPGAKEKDSDSHYSASPISGEPKIPNFSRRQQFVDQVVNDHPLVARAMVNRVWALLMGRGLVHPFDKMDSAHPPSHPELLDWLSRDFREQGYDIRRLIKSIVLTKAYQLDSKQPAADADPAGFSWYLEKPLVAESWSNSIAQLLRNSSENHAVVLSSFRQHFPDVLPEENLTRLSQTMFLSNNESLHKFIRESRKKGSLHSRLLEMPDHAARVQLIYKEAFSRQPDESELAAGKEFLSQRHDRLDQALDHLLWAIVTSAEFRINH